MKPYAFCEHASQQDTDECILWPFWTDRDGYGKVSRLGRSIGAHRVVCILAHGPPPKTGLHAAHSCRNRHCINPKHISWKTPKENVWDRVRDGTQVYGENSCKAKLTDREVEEARRLSSELTIRQLSTRFGVAEPTMRNIVVGRNRTNGRANAQPKRLGYAIGEKVPGCKLTAQQVIEIRSRYAIGGISQSALSREYGVNNVTIFNIVHFRTWRHL